MTPERRLFPGLVLLAGSVLGCSGFAGEPKTEVWVATAAVPPNTKIQTREWFDRTFKRITFTARELADSPGVANDPGMVRRLGESPGEKDDYLKFADHWVITKGMKPGDILSKDFIKEKAVGPASAPVELRDGYAAVRAEVTLDGPPVAASAKPEDWAELVVVRKTKLGETASPIARYVRVINFDPTAVGPEPDFKATVRLELAEDEADLVRQAGDAGDRLRLRWLAESELRAVTGANRYAARHRRPVRRYPAGLAPVGE